MRGPRLSQPEFAARLKSFTEKLKPGSVAVLVSNPERTRSRDTEYKYRQSSDILYLNGFPEPNCVLIVSNLKDEQTLTMLVQPKDPARERWTGIREGVEGAKASYLAQEAYPIEHAKDVLRRALKKAKRVYYKLGVNPAFDKIFLSAYKGRKRKLKDPTEILAEMRLFKSEEELALMQHSAQISAESHRSVMSACRPGMHEYELQAVAEYVFTRYGAAAPAYNTIMAGGSRATVLHYVNNDKVLHDGELVLNDSACEYQGYAADITRTFPVSGRFTPAQREIYELVLAAQEAAIKATAPGVRLSELHEIAMQVMEEGLVKLGILPPPAEGKGEKKKKKARMAKKRKKAKGAEPEKPVLTIRDFFMHGTSHWLGLDVHDVGNYQTKDGTRSDKGKGKRRKLKPGMCFTVEPGLYFDAGDERVPEQYRGIGVRIEDDVAVTETGYLVLTSAVPKSVAEIEALMATARSTPPATPKREDYPRHFPGIH